jgi:signal transduction histidine kinase
MQSRGRLEEKVKARTRELKDTEIEKDQIVEQLIQAEKLAVIGTMASGIGHEINNPLYAILTKAEAIRDEADISQCRKYGEDVVEYVNRIAEIVKDFAGYARPGSEHDLELVDVNEKLFEAMSMARQSLLSDHVEISEDLTPVPRILGKPEEIRQAFFNVIRNGIQAMNGKGTLEVTSRLESDQVSIRIGDTGLGISEDDVLRIFDPFFTTKGPDEGQGLGLYIVRQIVNKYGGEIGMESHKGTGTVFCIRFPARATS